MVRHRIHMYLPLLWFWFRTFFFVLIWFHSEEFILQKNLYHVSSSSASMQSTQGNPGQPLMSTATLQRGMLPKNTSVITTTNIYRIDDL